MSTRSMIAFNNGSTITAIYCHFDGYLEGVGKTLMNYWNDIEKVEALMELGDLSVLGTEIGEKQNFDNCTNDNWCLAYGRDRGETGTEAKDYSRMHYAEGNYKGVDYYYVFDGIQWSFKRAGYKKGYTPLAEMEGLANPSVFEPLS